MAVNRYTRLTDSRYNPLSLQEMMVAPAYLRQKHDEADATIGLYDNELAKVDALDIHNELALNRQKELYDELSGYSDELASSGFSNFNKSNLIKFNRKFQNEISPTGTIGKANAAKKQFEIEKANYIANATKMGYSPEAAGMNWERHTEAYKNAFDGRNITNIDSLYSPEYVNAIDRATELFKSAGLTERDIVNLGRSGIVTKDPRGMYVITRKGRNFVGSNAKQLQAAVDYINNQIKNPTSTVHKSLIHQGKNPENVLDEIAGLANVYLKDKTIKSSGSTISNFQAGYGSSANGVGGLTVANSRFSIPAYSKMSYSDVAAKIDKLNNTKTLGTAEKDELNTLKMYKARLDEKLNSDPTHAKLLRELKVLNETEPDVENDPLYKMMIGDLPTKPMTVDGRTVNVPDYSKVNPDFERKARDMVRQRHLSKISNIEKQLDEIKKNHASDVQLVSTNYVISPSTAKEQTLNKVFNKSIGDIITSNPQALMQNTQINGLITEDGVKPINTANDIKGISNLFAKADPSKIKVVGFTPKGINGKPEYTIRVQTDEDNSYDLDGVWGSGNEDIGKGKAVTVKVSFNDNNNGLVKNINGYLQNYIMANGGERGVQLVESMNINAAITKYKGQTWGTIANSRDIYTNPALKKIYMSKMSALMSTGKSREEAYNILKNQEFYE